MGDDGSQRHRRHQASLTPLTPLTPLASLAAAFDREWAAPAASQPYTAFWRFRPSARDLVEDLLGPVAGRRVLDLGAGTGASSLRLAHRGDAKTAVVAVEISRTGLRALAANAATAGCARRVQPLCADVGALPLADASVDLVHGENFLMYVDPARVGAECHRVLRPGGRAVFIEPTAHHPLVRLYRLLRSPYRATGPRYFALDDLPRLAAPFGSEDTETAVCHAEFYLFAALALPLAGRPLLFALAFRLLDRLDRALFRALPAARRLGWLTVIALRKGEMRSEK